MDKLDFKDADQPMPIPPEDKNLFVLESPSAHRVGRNRKCYQQSTNVDKKSI